MIHMILNDCELDRERLQRLIMSRIRKPNYSDSAESFECSNSVEFLSLIFHATSAQRLALRGSL